MAGMEAVLEALLRPGEPVAVIHGTTVATNAVIERKGESRLLVTRGFRDIRARALKLRNR